MNLPAIRNQAWSEHSGVYCTDASDLRMNLDPWNRQLPNVNPVCGEETDGEEITHWEGTTTVNGQPVKLKIFND